jgi:hypothetical protein
MDNTNATQQFKGALSQHERVGIMVGKNPTLDDMAAALALYLSLKSAHKAVTIASASQPIVELSSLVGIDEVKATLGGTSGDLVVSFPYQEGEIEKVSYTIESGFLNIVVKAGENGLNFTEQDVRFTRGSAGMPSLLIIVGTAQLASLSDLFNPEALKDTMIMNIDNKQENQGYGDVVLVNPQYSSVSELMGSLMLSAGMPMDVDAAQNLMNGISFATDNFQSPQTSFYAFEIVAELMRRGAVRTPQAMPRREMPQYMQQPQATQGVPMPRSSQMPRQQMPRPPFGQQQQQQPRSPQQQPRMGQRMNQQPQQQNQPRQQQNQQQTNNRQEEIRRALAEQARQARMNQPQPQPQQNQQPQQQQPQQPAPAPQQHTAPSDEAPSDWLTPKVYKGSTNIS